MGKNKNKIDAPINEEAQPEIVQPEELDQPIEATQETATNSDAEVTDMLESKPDAEIPTPAPVAKGKSKAKTEAPVVVDEAILSAINDRKKYTVIVIKGLSPLKPDTEKTVSGNVAKVLIKKGFVKLKN